jgi:DNA (cytosine-5)-methyltransferase 1
VIVDLFCGARGWTVGLRSLGIDDIGVEIWQPAIDTSMAAGMATIQADASELDPIPCDGLIASPPCQDWSSAGGRAKRGGKSGWLVDLPLRWVDAVRPRWVALEQVPPALEVWQDHAQVLRMWGYSVWTGVLNAANYGVPQTRQRAILMASLDRPALPPEPTHAQNPEPSLFGPQLRPWVTMAEALGWVDVSMEHQRGRGMAERHGGRSVRHSSSPAITITSGAGRRVVLHTNRGQDADGNRQTVTTDRPAPSLTSKAGGQWVFDRPATTVCADSRIAPPGHRDRAGGELPLAAGTVRLTIEQALILQGFPPHLSSVESAQHLTQRMAERRWVTVGLRHFCTDGHRLRFLQVAR